MKTHAIAVLLLVVATGASAQDTGSSLTLMEAAAFAVSAQTGSSGEPSVSPFGAGTWSFQTYGSATFGDDAGELYLAHVGVGYHFIDALSLNFEAVGGAMVIEDLGTTNGEDAAAIGLDLLLRWHFCRRDGWSLYMDGGAGLIQGTASFPANGTHFNFTPQFGLGITASLTDTLSLMGGARWHHISNAGKNGQDENPGYDGAMLYGGVMFAF